MGRNLFADKPPAKRGRNLFADESPPTADQAFGLNATGPKRTPFLQSDAASPAMQTIARDGARDPRGATFTHAQPAEPDPSQALNASIADNKEKIDMDRVISEGYAAAAHTPAPTDHPGVADAARHLLDNAFAGFDELRAAHKRNAAIAELEDAQHPVNDQSIGHAFGSFAQPSQQQADVTADPEVVQQKVDNAAHLIKQADALSRRAGTVKQSKATRQFVQASDWGDAWDAFKKDPVNVILDVGARSAAGSLEALGTGVVGGAVGGPAGFAAGMGLGSAHVDYASGIVQGLQQHGVDVSDPKALKKAVANDKLMSQVRQQAGEHAAAVGAFDAAAGALAPVRLAPKGMGAVTGEATNIGAQTGAQAALGAAGEASGEMVSAQKLQPGQIAAEAAGEAVSAPVDVASAALQFRSNGDNRARDRQQGESRNTNNPADDALMKLYRREPVGEADFQALKDAGYARDNTGNGPAPVEMTDQGTQRFNALRGQTQQAGTPDATPAGDSLETEISNGQEASQGHGPGQRASGDDGPQGPESEAPQQRDAGGRPEQRAGHGGSSASAEQSQLDDQAPSPEGAYDPTARLKASLEADDAKRGRSGRKNSAQLSDERPPKSLEKADRRQQATEQPDTETPAWRVARAAFYQAPDHAGIDHEQAVRDALKRGDRVPADVMVDYPELAAKHPSESKPDQKNTPATRAEPEQTTDATRKVTAGRGHKVDVAPDFVDAADLVASHTAQGNPNPGYPEALQPRDRSRLSGRAQVDQISRQLDPELLDDTAKASDGAPIVGEDNVVESGNGRVAAIRQAYDTGRGDGYRQFVQRKAQQAGVDVSGMTQPVYIRRRATPMDDTQRAEFARAANQSDLSGMSPAEQARTDAARLSDDDMAQFDPGDAGNVLADSNHLFLQRFADKTGDVANLRTADGRWNKKMADRAQAAVFAKAYDDPRLLELATEEADPEIRNVLAGLQQAAPAFARAGHDADLGTARHLTDAVELVREARVKGQSVDSRLAQTDAFGEIDANTADIARVIDANKRSGKRLGAYFRRLGELTEHYERSGTDRLFGDTVGVDDIIHTAGQADGIQNPETAPEPVEAASDLSGDTRASTGRRQPAGRERTEAGGPEQAVSEPRSGYEPNPADQAEARRQIEQVRADHAQALRAHAEHGEPLTAPNGRPSNLTEHQWVHARTPNFRRWFGDWLRASHKQFLDGPAVARANGDEFGRDAGPIVSAVTRFYQQQFGGGVNIPGVGRILLDRRAVKRSRNHGLNRPRIAAFAIVPDVLKKGRLIDSAPLRDASNGRMLTFAAPVRVGDQESVAAVQVKSDDNARRMWVHQVVLKEKLRDGYESGPVLDDNQSSEPEIHRGALENILRDIYAVNNADVSKIVDDNGEPLVVYHGTLSDFDRFDPEHGPFYFSDTDVSSGYALRKGGINGSVMPAYLALKNPHEVDAQGRQWHEVNDPAISEALARGADGVIIRSVYDWSGVEMDTPTRATDVYIAFSPEQIKSAIGNRGGYNPAHDSTIAESQLSLDLVGTDPYGDLFENPSDPARQGDLFATRPGTTDAQRDVGRDALADFERRVLGRGRGQASVLGLRLLADFRGDGHAQLVGQRATSPDEIATLAQVYRDPRFETLRAIFVRNGVVVGENAYTSRLPAAVNFDQKTLHQIEADEIAHEADGYYLLHNHPSGRPTPSDADRRMTEWMADNVGTFKGHVVIDHNAYATINRVGLAAEHELTNEAPTQGAEGPAEALIGQKITQPEHAARLAKQAESGHAPAMITTDAGGTVRAIFSIPSEWLVHPNSNKRLAAYAARAVRESGSGGHVIAVMPAGSSVADRNTIRAHAKRGTYGDTLTDILLPEGSLRAAGLLRPYEHAERRRTYRVGEQQGDLFGDGFSPPKSYRQPKAKATTGDLFGDDTQNAQAIADETRRRDAKRSPDRDVPADMDGGLFANQTTDIEDVSRGRLESRDALGASPGHTVFERSVDAPVSSDNQSPWHARFLSLGDQRVPYAQTLADAQDITGLHMRIPLQTANLGQTTAMAFDASRGNILISNRQDLPRPDAAMAMTEELYHSLDVLPIGHSIAASSKRFQPGGDVWQETLAAMQNDSVIDRFFQYPLNRPKLSTPRKSAELFARLGVIYQGNPEAMRRLMPIAHSVIDEVHHEIQRSDTGLRGQDRASAERGLQVRTNRPSMRSATGRSGTGGRHWQSDPGVEQLRGALARILGGSRLGKRVPQGPLASRATPKNSLRPDLGNGRVGASKPGSSDRGRLDGLRNPVVDVARHSAINTPRTRNGPANRLSAEERPAPYDAAPPGSLTRADREARQQAETTQPRATEAAYPNQLSAPPRRQDVRLLGRDKTGHTVAAGRVVDGKWQVVSHTGDMLGYTTETYASREAAEDAMRGNGLDVSLDAPRDPNGQQGEFQGHDLAAPERGYFGEVGQYLQYKAQDKFNALKRLQEQAESQRGERLADRGDPYLAETLYHGRTRAAMDTFDENQVDPLLDALQKTGFGLRQLNDYTSELPADIAERFGHLSAVDAYLYARHAPEANARLEQINPGEPAMSGMSDAEAAQIMDALKAKGEGEALAGIADRVDAMTQSTRDRLVSSGLEKQDTIDAWEGAYTHYVPLKGEPGGPDENASQRLSDTGRGFDVRGRASQRRLGRRSPASNILANVVSGHYATIRRAEKNQVGQAMLRFAQEHPSALWEVNQPMTKRGLDPVTGLVTNQPDSSQRQRDNVFIVRVNGVEHHIAFNEDSADATRIVSSLKNLGATDMGVFVKSLHWVNSKLSLLSTSLNPEFVVSNFTRDLQTAFINLNDSEAGHLKRQIMKDAASGKAFRAIWHHQRGHRESQWAQYYGDFLADGASTGWMEGYDSIDQFASSLTQRLDREKPGTWPYAKRQGRNLMDFVERTNMGVENSVRLSAYIHARENGLSRPRAAQLAKELTVNFNRKGEAGNALNAFYLFYNASVQGSARIIKAGVTSAKARRYMTAAVAMGIGLDIANRMIAGTDDDGENRYDRIPDYVKQSNWIFMLPDSDSMPDWAPDWMQGPDGDYIKFPLPYGYNVLNYTGQKVGRAFSAATGEVPDYHPGDEAAGLAMAALNAFNPVGASPSLTQLVSPTITDPIVQWAENKNFAGIPIHPEDNPFGPPPPAYTQHFSGVRPWSLWVAKELNLHTGGSTVRPGAVNVNPELLDHLWDFATGGVGRFAAETASLPSKVQDAISGKADINAYQIPFVGKLYGTPRTGASRSLYYDRSDQMRMLEQEYQLARKDGNGQRQAELRRQFPNQTRVLGLYDGISKQLRRLGRAANKIEASDLSDAEKSQRLKRIDDTRERLYERFNRRYHDVVLTPNQS